MFPPTIPTPVHDVGKSAFMCERIGFNLRQLSASVFDLKMHWLNGLAPAFMHAICIRCKADISLRYDQLNPPVGVSTGMSAGVPALSRGQIFSAAHSVFVNWSHQQNQARPTSAGLSLPAQDGCSIMQHCARQSVGNSCLDAGSRPNVSEMWDWHKAPGVLQHASPAMLCCRWTLCPGRSEGMRG